MMRITQQNMRRTATDCLKIWSLCALSAEELLLACGAEGLRALSLDTGQLAARRPTAMQYDVRRVAFDARTDTLLLLVWPPNAGYIRLVSLRRYANEWLEVQNLSTSISIIYVSVSSWRCATCMCCSFKTESCTFST